MHSFCQTLEEAARIARDSNELSCFEHTRVAGVCRRADRGWTRPVQLVEDAKKLIVSEAIARGLLPTEGPGDDYDWDRLLELFVMLIEAIIELWKFFGGM